jgi:exodeoxyribonuclease-3
VDIYDGCAVNEAQPSYISKPIIICGDFNVAATTLDIKNAKSNIHNAGFTIEEREKFQQLLGSGYTDSFRSLHPDEEKYSWWSYRFKAREKNIGWRLDYFLVSGNASDKIVEADIHTEVMGSDHAPISLQIDI